MVLLGGQACQLGRAGGAKYVVLLGGQACQLGRAGRARYVVLLGDGGPRHLFEGGGTAGGCISPSLGCCFRTSSDRAGHIQILGFVLWASRAETQRRGYSTDVGQASRGHSLST